ncbi:MAG: SRPBCC domain-containing protein [Candidatus Limnocylindrales bacterium]
MAHPFEVRGEQVVNAPPEQVWEALSNGALLDGWWMGENELEPRLGGAFRTTLPGFTMESTITTWDPPHHFANTSPKADDGRLMTFAFEIEGRAGGTTTLRFVHSGFLPGDDWEQEYEALQVGDPAYVAKLAEYVEHFFGRTAVPITLWGPQVGSDSAWAGFRDALGVGPDVAVGDRARFRAEGLPDLDGEIDYLSSHFIGLRTADGMFRFIHGMGTVAIGHHLYGPVDRTASEQAWQAWLDRTFA